MTRPRDTGSYDTRQLHPLRACLLCKRAYFMKRDICHDCKPPTWGTKPKVERDVSGHIIWEAE